MVPNPHGGNQPIRYDPIGPFGTFGGPNPKSDQTDPFKGGNPFGGNFGKNFPGKGGFGGNNDIDPFL